MTDHEISALRDLAGKACVHFRPFEPDFPRDTSDRLLREHGVRIPPERILTLAAACSPCSRHPSEGFA